MGMSTSLLKSEEKSMTGENFYVGEGFLTFRNYYLPLSAVSMVKLTEDKSLNMLSCKFLLIAGIIFLLLPLELGLLRAFGLFAIIVGGAGGLFVNWQNKNKNYYLSIYVDSGNVLSFAHKNSEFILKAMAVIKNCIKDQSMRMYVDMRQEHIEQNIGEMNMFYKNESNVNSGNTTYGNMNVAGDGSTIFDNGNNSNLSGVVFGDNNNVNSITDSEWQQLTDYFEKRKLDFEEGDYKRGICERIAGYAKSRDVGKLKNYLNQVESVLKQIVVGVAAKGVTNIIADIMHL